MLSCQLSRPFMYSLSLYASLPHSYAFHKLYILAITIIVFSSAATQTTTALCFFSPISLRLCLFFLLLYLAKAQTQTQATAITRRKIIIQQFDQSKILFERATFLLFRLYYNPSQQPVPYFGSLLIPWCQHSADPSDIKYLPVLKYFVDWIKKRVQMMWSPNMVLCFF